MNVKMTKSHYEFISSVIRSYSFYYPNAGVTVAEHFASMLPATNPKFSRERFLQSCQPDTESEAENVLFAGPQDI